MNVFATWIIESSGHLRGVVLDKATLAITMRTPETYATRAEAQGAALALISDLARAA